MHLHQLLDVFTRLFRNLGREIGKLICKLAVWVEDYILRDDADTADNEEVS